MKQANICSAICSALLALPVTGTLQAQDFTLFEAVETSDRQPPSQSRPGRESRVTTAKPDFTLLGTSRIGNRYSVILAHRDGEKVVVTAETGSSTPITNYNEFSLVTTAAGKVSINLPPSSSCIDFPESGVHCNESGTIAELTLPTRPAIASNRPQTLAGGIEQVAASAEAEASEEPINPFELMRVRALNGNREEADPSNPAVDENQNGRFVPRRIDPAEVPPGMRVVSTPFGDRLVEQ